MDVCVECCVLSGRGLCDGPITRAEESYRLWCVVVCALETWWMRRPWPTGGCRTKNKQTNKHGITLCCGIRRPASSRMEMQKLRVTWQRLCNFGWFSAGRSCHGWRNISSRIKTVLCSGCYKQLH